MRWQMLKGTVAPLDLPRPAPRILLVDDEPKIRDFVSRALTAAGYLVEVACDGARALARAGGGGVGRGGGGGRAGAGGSRTGGWWCCPAWRTCRPGWPAWSSARRIP